MTTDHEHIKRVTTRWVRRFRPPILFALIGIALALLPSVLARYVEVSDGWRSFLHVSSRVLFTIAIGWAATTVVDALLKRRLARLNLTEADNLAARKLATRLDVMRRVWVVLGGLITLAAAFTLIPGVKQIGVSLFASAGIAGLALGIAARPVLANLIAGIQIAFTQPIRIDDAVVVENEWGWIEEIGLFYVVIKIWDWRRLVVPISYFTENTFQNWTRQNASIIGSVFWSVDYRAPVGAMRDKLTEICKRTKLWDGNVVNLQVVEADNQIIQIRALASARTSPEAWDLRCFIREEMISWLQHDHPGALPRIRAEGTIDRGKAEETGPMPPPASFTRDDSLDPHADQAVP
ncbi:mechanosensitive ion channel family protein [Parvularcula sp. LCG005]|uniref:mechanosensitive ion channel family protein n=1 Tax=Parvularcula sp. LCG005 TaxID=3078805 RepID=UPI0029423DFD|nr:mechanosensitive ion channel family protein [Parvularcula sp. LCG005]WOI54333.1 mechanosensitive ion channel family protein [Parvularcula sp. LCG005]